MEGISVYFHGQVETPAIKSHKIFLPIVLITVLPFNGEI